MPAVPTKDRYDRERCMEEQRQYRARNPEKYRVLQQKTQANHFARKKAQALAILGDKCKHCGFSDPRALQIDHVNGNGRLERRTNNGRGVIHIYRKIIAGNTTDYQLLCANCNWIKRIENGEHLAHLIS